MGQEWVTVTDACQSLAISQRTLYRRIDKGLIESKLDNGKRFVLIDLPSNKEKADNFDDMANMADMPLIEELKQKIAGLEASITEKDKSLEEARKASDESRKALEDAQQRHDTIVMQLTRNQQLMLESSEMKQKRKSWLARLFRKEKA